MKLSAKRLEANKKFLEQCQEKHNELVYKTYTAPNMFSNFNVKDGAREFISTINTNEVDRDKEVVVPEGMSLKNYSDNGIIALNHDLWSLPIGGLQWIKRFTQDAIKGIVLKGFIAEGVEKADDVFKLMQQKILTSTSIGFGVKEAHAPTDEEIKLNPKWKNARRIITKSELFEVSIVAVPANTSATIHAVSKGMVPDWLKDKVEMPEPVGVEKVPEELATIEKPIDVGHIIDITKVADVKKAPLTEDELIELTVLETQELYETRVLGRVSK